MNNIVNTFFGQPAVSALAPRTLAALNNAVTDGRRERSNNIFFHTCGIPIFEYRRRA